jgi:ATP synthase protein I
VTDGRLSTVAKILCYQVLIIAVVSLAFVVGGWQKGLSAALGGLAAFVPNLYFALRVSGAAGQEAKKVLRSFYVGESVPRVEILPLMAGYIAALSIFWFALLMR